MSDTEKELNHFLDEAMSSGAGLSDAPTLNDLKVAIGFTPKDVELLRSFALFYEIAPPLRAASGLLADRIEALLPPREVASEPAEDVHAYGEDDHSQPDAPGAR